MNHEFLSWTARIQVYAESLAHGDPFPLWYAEGNSGLGSPMPLFYHKLFNVVAGLIYLFSGSMKAAACLTVYLFSLLAIIGLFQTCLLLQAGFYRALLVAVCFPHLNYATTNWLVRGAFAEFAAFCLCTWLMWWCVRLLVTRHFHGVLGLILLGVFLAHVVIAYFAIPMLALAFMIHVVWQRPRLAPTLGKLALAAGTFLVGAVPFLWLMHRAGPLANLEFFKIYSPIEQLVSIRKYLIDTRYVWGADWRFFTVQLDVFFVVGTALLGWRLARPRSTSFEPAPSPSRPLWMFCALAFLFFFMLQTPLAIPFYRVVPGAEYLQFPWRLLCFLTPLLVILFVLADKHARVIGPRMPYVLVGVCLATILLNCCRPIRYDWFSATQLEGNQSCHWGEYLPMRLRGGNRSAVALPELAAWQEIGPTARAEDSEILPFESGHYLERAYRVSSVQETSAVFPVIYSGMEIVVLEDNQGRRRLVHGRTDEDPRVRVDLPKGCYILRIQLPTFTRAFLTIS